MTFQCRFLMNKDITFHYNSKVTRIRISYIPYSNFRNYLRSPIVVTFSSFGSKPGLCISLSCLVSLVSLK